MVKIRIGVGLGTHTPTNDAARFPDLDPTEVVPVGLDALRDRLEGFVAVGASKFVVIPLEEPSDWEAELTDVAAAVLPLEA